MKILKILSLSVLFGACVLTSCSPSETKNPQPSETTNDSPEDLPWVH